MDSERFSKSNIETLEKCYLMWFLDCDRSTDLGEARPELGHATNAAVVVGLGA